MYSSILLDIFTLLCNQFLELFHLANPKLCVHWTTPHFPLLSIPGNHHLLTVSMSLTTLYTSHKIMHYVSSCDCFILLSIMPSSFTHIVAGLNCFPFQGWVLFHCIHIAHFVNPSICWWTVQLLPSLGCCDNAMDISVQILKCFGKKYEQLNLWNYNCRSLFSPSILPQNIPVKLSFTLIYPNSCSWGY